MKKILIADDNGLTRMIIKKMLNSYEIPMDVIEATNGKDTLKEILEGGFHVLFLDMNMPTLSGFNVANYIKNKEIDDLVIIAISANLDDKNIDFLKTLGVSHFIPKPFEKKHFDDVVLPILSKVML
jgi:two-component system, sensor histidine kinase